MVALRVRTDGSEAPGIIKQVTSIAHLGDSTVHDFPDPVSGMVIGILDILSARYCSKGIS